VLDLEAEYNNRARVPEHPSHIAAWQRDAQAYRYEAANRATLGAPYGARDRERYDLFEPLGVPCSRCVVFFHGGYWQALDRSFFSHVAKGLNANGVAVAIAGYDLCPEVSIGHIVGQAREAVLAIWRRTGRQLVAVGHSAGGHLAACLLATDWQAHDHATPAGLVSSAYSLSGLFDLLPLVKTSINGPLRLDAGDARIWSPILWRAPAGLQLDAVVGARESSEFLRQSRDICSVWGRHDVGVRFESMPDADHFTILAPLADGESPMVHRITALARAGA
jgi:arylformamidase